MIFGVSESKFEYQGTEVLLDHSNIIPMWAISNNVENKSVINGTKYITNLGDYSEFQVEVHLGIEA